jgi:acyl dehydratase
MPIDYDEIMQMKASGLEARYDDKDTILYALGVGFMRDPLDEKELPFVYENALKVVPTFASVLPRGVYTDGRPLPPQPFSKLNFLMIVDGERRIQFHKPLPPMAEIISDERVVGVFDKGADKGALLVLERVVSDKSTGDKLCTVTATIFARGDGGFGGPKEGAPQPHTLPMRTPDIVKESDTRPDQAFLYALSGDRNPLHRDPRFAKMAGFPRPILHGLCTYGTACRAVLGSVASYDPARITGFDARFSAPVFPGETIITEMWVDGNIVSFRARAKGRDATVLNNGKCTLAS